MGDLKHGDTSGIRREREKLGAGRWGGSLLLMVIAGIPLLVGTHFRFFPDATEPKVITAFASLDGIPILFDPISQEPQARYCGDVKGAIELVGKDVEFSPTTGEPCWPLTPAVVKALRDAEARRLEAEAEHQRIAEAEAARLHTERQEQAAREAAQRAEAKFRDRYVNSSALGQLHSGHITITVSNPRLERAIASSLRNRGLSASTNIVTDQVFEGDILHRLAGGDSSLLARLQLSGRDGRLLLGEFKRGTLRETGVGNTVSIRGSLSVSLVSLSGSAVSTLPTLRESGAGFDEDQALNALEERLVVALINRPEVAALLH